MFTACNILDRQYLMDQIQSCTELLVKYALDGIREAFETITTTNQDVFEH